MAYTLRFIAAVTLLCSVAAVAIFVLKSLMVATEVVTETCVVFCATASEVADVSVIAVVTKSVLWLCKLSATKVVSQFNISVCQ